MGGELTSQLLRKFGAAEGFGGIREAESIHVDPAYRRLLVADEHDSEHNIKVYTVGAAARGREDVEIDEETLQTIASLTGGAYFRAEDESALESVYDEIDQLEKSEITTDSYVEYEERFSAFVLPALVLLLLEVLLLGSRFRKLP